MSAAAGWQEINRRAAAAKARIAALPADASDADRAALVEELLPEAMACLGLLTAELASLTFDVAVGGPPMGEA